MSRVFTVFEVRMSSIENVAKELQTENIGKLQNLNVKFGIIPYVSNENFTCFCSFEGQIERQRRQGGGTQERQHRSATNIIKK